MFPALTFGVGCQVGYWLEKSEADRPVDDLFCPECGEWDGCELDCERVKRL